MVRMTDEEFERGVARWFAERPDEGIASWLGMDYSEYLERTRRVVGRTSDRSRRD